MGDLPLAKWRFAPQKPGYFESGGHCKPVDIAAAERTNGHDFRRDDVPEGVAPKAGYEFVIPWKPTIGQPEAANSDDYVRVPGFEPYVSPLSGYDTLRDILDDAFAHAATGKGKERHARDLPFDDQPMLTTARMVGPGFPLGQAIKKSQEAAGMIERGQYDAAEAECLGAINYLAGAVAWMREQKEGKVAA